MQNRTLAVIVAVVLLLISGCASTADVDRLEAALAETQAANAALSAQLEAAQIPQGPQAAVQDLVDALFDSPAMSDPEACEPGLAHAYSRLEVAFDDWDRALDRAKQALDARDVDGWEETIDDADGSSLMQSRAEVFRAAVWAGPCAAIGAADVDAYNALLDAERVWSDAHTERMDENNARLDEMNRRVDVLNANGW